MANVGTYIAAIFGIIVVVAVIGVLIWFLIKTSKDHNKLKDIGKPEITSTNTSVNAIAPDVKIVGASYKTNDTNTNLILGTYLQRVFEDLQLIGCHEITKILTLLKPEVIRVVSVMKCSDLQNVLENQIFSQIILPADSPVSKQALVSHLTNLTSAIFACEKNSVFVDGEKTWTTLIGIIKAICYNS